MKSILTAGASLLCIALILMLLFRKKRTAGEGKERGRGNENRSSSKQCPLCKSSLAEGMRVHSVLYPKSPGAADRLMEIHGCDYCYPAPAKANRICPVCGKLVPPDGDVFARVFETKARRHVHVLGCPLCYRRKNP